MPVDKPIMITWGEFKAWKDKNLERNNSGDDTIIYGVITESGLKSIFGFGLFRTDMPEGTVIKEGRR